MNRCTEMEDPFVRLPRRPRFCDYHPAGDQVADIFIAFRHMLQRVEQRRLQRLRDGAAPDTLLGDVFLSDDWLTVAEAGARRAAARACAGARERSVSESRFTAARSIVRIAMPPRRRHVEEQLEIPVADEALGGCGARGCTESGSLRGRGSPQGRDPDRHPPDSRAPA